MNRPSTIARDALRLLEGRRVFIAAGLALIGFGRRVWAQPADPPVAVRYAPLTLPVNIPVEAVAAPWRPVSFVAEARQPRRSAQLEDARRVLISGVLFRNNTQLSALCVTCPHEQCHVDLVTDEARLARLAGNKSAQPLFECGCHFSVFDPAADGARVSGEAPRGLYRFRIAGVRDGMVEITDIEEVALSEV